VTNVSLADLTVEHFQPLVGQPFRLTLTDGVGVTAELKLQAAEARGAKAFDKRLPFRLEFTGPAQPAIGQALVGLENDALGRLDIFIVAVAGDAETRTYEAIFT